MNGVRLVDSALAIDAILTRHEAADVLLREYGAGPGTPDSVIVAAARLTQGDTQEASAAVAWLGIRFEDHHQEDQ